MLKRSRVRGKFEDQIKGRCLCCEEYKEKSKDLWWDGFAFADELFSYARNIFWNDKDSVI